MTIEVFLAKLPQDGWGNYSGQIRRKSERWGNLQCPIAALYSEVTGRSCLTSNFRMAANFLELSQEDATKIASAADGHHHGALWHELREAVGLSAVKTKEK